MAAAMASTAARRYSTSTAATRPPPCTPPARRAPPVCRSSSTSSGRGWAARAATLVDYVVSSADYPKAGRGVGAREIRGIVEGPPPAGTRQGVLRTAKARCASPWEPTAPSLSRATAPTPSRVPAWRREAAAGAIRDTTGAGDAFIGAVAVGIACGLPLTDTLRLASCVAAANCCADGARGGMPTRAELPAEIRELLDRGR